MLWATPTLTVSYSDVAELNRGLARIILEKEREIISRGTPTTVAGLEEGLTTHWLEYNVLLWDYPEIKEFRRMVLDGLDEFLKLAGQPTGRPNDPGFKVSGISCWANVLRFGEALEVHHHDPAFISAHYQVQSGNDSNDDAANKKADNSGHTIYFRPGFLDRSHGGKAAGPTSLWDADWRIDTTPVEGKLFLFPSYVRHEVRPYTGKTQRISIALDAYIEKQEALIYFSPPRWFVPE